MLRLFSAAGGSDAPTVPSAGEPTGGGARGPGAGMDLPSLDAHFLRIWEKQKDVTWHRIPPWETLYRQVVEGPKQLRLYVTSWMNSARNQAIIYENYWSFLLAEKPKMGFKAGGVWGNSSCQFETDIFVFSFFQWIENRKTFIVGQPEMSG